MTTTLHGLRSLALILTLAVAVPESSSGRGFGGMHGGMRGGGMRGGGMRSGGMRGGGMRGGGGFSRGRSPTAGLSRGGLGNRGARPGGLGRQPRPAGLAGGRGRGVGRASEFPGRGRADLAAIHAGPARPVVDAIRSLAGRNVEIAGPRRTSWVDSSACLQTVACIPSPEIT